MKYLVTLVALLIIATAATAASAAAQSLVFSNQTITVEADQLSLDSVEFDPGGIVTNTVLGWTEVEQILENGLFAGGGSATNIVQQQTSTEVISTNAPAWTAHVVFRLPAGHEWSLNNYPVSVQRFVVNIDVPLQETALQAIFADAYPALQFAATTGRYQPVGSIRDGIMYAAASVLAGGN